MKTNAILDEVWRIKDQLAAEAGYDIDRFVEQLRAWTAARPASGPVVHNAEELRRLATKEGVQRYPSVAAKPAQVRETPPRKRKKS